MKNTTASENKIQTTLFKEDVALINGDFNIVKENTLIKANYALSLYEHRVMAVIASLMKPSDTKETRYFFRVRDFAEYFGLKSKDIYSALQDVFVKLRQKTFALQRPNDAKRITGWINWAEIIPSTGIVEVSVDEKIRPYFLEINKTIGYTKYQLKYVREFKCPYAYRLYEKFKEELRGEKKCKFDMTFEEIKEWLVIEDQYHQFSDLRKRVLLPALEDINGVNDEIDTKRKKVKKISGNGSDIKVVMVENRPGRKIIGVTFHITLLASSKEKTINTFDPSPNVEILSQRQNQIITEFLSVGVNQTVIDQSIDKYGIDNLEYMYTNYEKKKNPDDRAAYAAATLLNGYGIPKNEHEKNMYERDKKDKENKVAVLEIAASQAEAAATEMEIVDIMIDDYLNRVPSSEALVELQNECKKYLVKTEDQMANIYTAEKASKLEPHYTIFRNYIKVQKLQLREAN